MGQPYPHRSDKWEKYYSLRNTVDASYSYIKDSMAEDLGNPAKLAVAPANIRRIIAVITQLGSAKQVTSKNRRAHQHVFQRPALPGQRFGTAPHDHVALSSVR